MLVAAFLFALFLVYPCAVLALFLKHFYAVPTLFSCILLYPLCWTVGIVLHNLQTLSLVHCGICGCNVSFFSYHAMSHHANLVYPVFRKIVTLFLSCSEQPQ